MKKILLLTIIALSVSAFAQTKTPVKSASVSKEMTVKEYFLAIPEEFIKAEPKKRVSWIDSESTEDGYLSYEIPIVEVTGNKDDKAKVFGNLQIFKKKKGGIVIGMTTNMCEEGNCVGQIFLLNYSSGKWSDVTGDLAPIIDNDEVIAILKKAPAWEKPLKDSVEVPLSLGFVGTDKLINYIAGGVNGDGGVVVKMFKWNGETFTEFEYEESLE